jgi:hypothetical protein
LTAETVEPGLYSVSAVRSAEPGDCPEDVPYEFKDQEVEPGDRACGGDKAELSGYTGDGSAESCSYRGTVTLTVVSARS